MNKLSPPAHLEVKETEDRIHSLQTPFKNFLCLGLVLAWSSFITGCMVGPAPYLPTTWLEQPQGVHKVSTGTPGPQLQVLIMYSGMFSSHSALRLTLANGNVVFWDPAGDYARQYGDDVFGNATVPENTKRVGDLIVENPPDLHTWGQYRWEVYDTSVEVFEWEISASQAERLYRILLEGTDVSHPAGNFTSLTWPTFCTVATSDFLRRFADDIVGLDDWQYFPHNLAKGLYRQFPDRVRIFTPKEKESRFIPPTAQTRNQSIQHGPIHH